MRVTSKKLSHLSLGVLISFGLFACSNSNDSSSTDSASSDGMGVGEGSTNGATTGGTDTGGTDTGGTDTGGTDTGGTDTGGTDTGGTDTGGTDTGGTDTGEASGGDGTGPGAGGCVTIARPEVGLKVKIEARDGDDSAGVVVTIERLITAFSNTSLTSETTTTSSFRDTEDGITITYNSTSSDTSTETFTIVDNYVRTTKSISTDVSTSTVTSTSDQFPGTTTNITTSSSTSYDPYQQFAIDEVCEGDNWESTYTSTTTSERNGTASPPETTNDSEKYIVEAVNVPLTTAAGPLNTVRLLAEDGDSKDNIWIDIDSGVYVFAKSESLSDPDDTSTVQVIEISRGN